MSALLALNWRRRSLTAIVLALAISMTVMVAGVFADAGNPISGTIRATAVDNHDGTVTVYLRGQWNWLSHNSDCNFDRAGIGVGLIWSDPTEAGYTVSKNAISENIGVKTKNVGGQWAADPNPLDEMVHPVDRGNQVEGYSVAGTDYPASQAFADPSPAGITATQLNAWRGGCGRQSLTATASKGSNTERTGQTCANGTTDCSTHPWGSWGYEKSGGGGVGYSHTYLKTLPNGQSGLPSRICANFYDVHGGGNATSNSFQQPNNTGEITVDGNDDNSIITNSFDQTDGANCIALVTTATATEIHNASNTVVTTVPAGTTVHDYVTVSAPGHPAPTGKVNIDWFSTDTCSGNPQSTSASLTLGANGQLDATAFARGPLTAGLYGFKAHYLGNNLYLPSDGACEPLRVVDASIQITPQTATNRIGNPHTFTAHVIVDDGTGSVNAPNGTSIFFARTGPGAFTSANPCTTSGGTGSCTITLNSSATGLTTVTASASLVLSTVSLTRSTDGTGASSGPAAKTWVDAKISIGQSATNRVGDPHTFTVTLWKDLGDGNGFVKAQGEHVNLTLTDANGAVHTLPTGSCTTAGANTNVAGECTVTFNSGTTGTVSAHASSTLTLAGLPVSVATDGQGLNSADALKTFVDAKITVTLDATHEVNNGHSFTVTLWKDLGDGKGFVKATGEDVDYTLTDSNGANSTLDAAASTCDNAGVNTDATGECTLVVTSNTPGDVTAQASSTLTIAGLTVTVATNGVAPNSGSAAAKFVDANIQISPQTATNPLSTNHTLTGHVNVNDGSGAFTNAPDGTTITFSLVNTGGASATFVGPNSCTTSGGTGSCDAVISSATAGTTTVEASTDVIVSGLSLHRETGDAKAGDSGHATKFWAAARISIAPDATNEVGHPHTFTVTLEKDTGTGTFVPANAEHVDVTLTNSNGATSTAPTGSCTTAGANTDAGGHCTITFTSPTAGKVTAHASATLMIGGATVTAASNGAGGSSVDAVKTFVDSNIQINPPTATNQIGQTHTFTAHVNVNNGSGNFAGAVGSLVTFSIDSGPGSLSNGNVSSTSCSTDANGNCTIDLVSSTTGVTIVSAHTTLVVGGVSLTRNTDGTGANSIPATKTWANARISISPDATNEIGQPHTFTVTLEQQAGNGPFAPAQGRHVDVTLTDSKGAGSVIDTASSTCDDNGANTDAGGQCTITFTSQTPGKVTAHASSTLSVAGSGQFTVETDGLAPNGGNAVKTFVDANIQISPQTATNPLSANHTLTGHVNVDTRSGAFGNAPNGTTIHFLLTNSGGASATFVSPNSCVTSGGTGSCDVVIVSSTSGTSTIKASTDVTVGGVTMHRETGDAKVGDSVDATKKWAAAKIEIAPNDSHEVGQTHTFTVTLSKDTGTGAFVPAAGEHVDVTLADSNGAAHTTAAGTCTSAGANTNASGRCTITTTSPTAGKVSAHASSTLDIGGATIPVETNGTAPNSGNAVATFVDANIQITPAQATNPLNTNHVLTGHVNVNDGSGGFVSASDGTTIDFSLVSGPGVFVGPSTCTTAGGTGSCTVTITSGATGTTKIRATTDVTVSGVSLHRQSDDGKAGDSVDAAKLWASAKIAIAPDGTHEIGQPHTFTVTLMKDTNAGTFVPAASEHIAFTLTDAKGANHTSATGSCTSAGANTDANGQCTITVSSNTSGTVTVHASSALAVSGTTLSVQTNGVAPNSVDAVATFVDANIQVTPATANNPVGTTHTLTGHVNVNAGLGGGLVNAPNGTTIAFTLSGPAGFVGPGGCTTAGGTGSCTVVISSSTAGTSTIRASTDVIVGGVVLHRESGDGKAADSADATKLWGDDTARTDILNASGGVVTTVLAGTIVHDKLFVGRTAGTPGTVPNPSGSVVFHRYSTIDCTGTSANQTVALTPGSPSTALTDDFAPSANMSYRAEYLGDANYPARLADCEPLTVTPVAAPAIAIVKNPKGQVVAVGGRATFTITVTNVGNTVLTDVRVDDPLSTNCSRTKADIPAFASMAPGATLTYSCTKTNVRASFDNVATATGTPPSGPNVTATDTAPVKAKALRPPTKKIKKTKKKTPKLVSHKRPKTTG